MSTQEILAYLLCELLRTGKSNSNSNSNSNHIRQKNISNTIKETDISNNNKYDHQQ